MLKLFKRSQEGSAVMKIFVGDLRSDERALVVGGLKRWAVHLGFDVEFSDQRAGCDLALLDADHAQYVTANANERVISIGSAKIYGADAQVRRPIRGFQLAAALTDVMATLPNANRHRPMQNFLHNAAA